jgi:hypothetical protein
MNPSASRASRASSPAMTSPSQRATASATVGAAEPADPARQEPLDPEGDRGLARGGPLPAT